MDIETRARARAARLPEGGVVLGIVRSERMRRALVRAAEAGEIPLEVVAPVLSLALPGPMSELRYRQFAGLAVGHVMADAGFEVANPRRRIPGAAPFRFGATYRKAPAPGEAPRALVARMVAALDDAEAREAHRLLARRLGLTGGESR